MNRIILALASAFVALVALTGIAAAHAKIDRCLPDIGSTNAAAPTEVRCWFTEELDTKQSTLSVTDSTNQRVDNNDAKVDLNDKEHKQVFATLKPLPQGVYRVAWKVVTPDDNASADGEWYFGVGQVAVPQSQSASTPSASTTPAVAASNPTPSTAPAANTLSDATRTYITAALILLGAGAIALIARRVIR